MRLALVALVCLPCLILSAELARYVPSADVSGNLVPMLFDVSGSGNHAIGSMKVSHDGTRLFFTPDEGIVLPYNVFPPILASQAFTLCGWVRNWPTSGNNLFRFQQVVAGGTFQMIAGAHFVWTNDLIYFDSWERITVAGLPTGAAKSNWLHFCLATDFDAKTHEVFFDGVSKTVVTDAAHPSPASIQPVTNTAQYAQFILAPYQWHGDLSDVRLFDTALDLAQVNTVMSDTPALPLVGDAACPAGWFAGATLCYKRIQQEQNYTAANAHCNTIGGELARVPTMADLRVLQGRSTAEAWVGASGGTMIGAQCQPNDKLDCKYVNGDAVRDLEQKYGPGEPDTIVANVVLGVYDLGIFDGGDGDRSFLCSAAASTGAASSNLCAPPRSVPKAANAAQSSVFCAWRAGFDAPPNSTTVPVNDWKLSTLGGAVAPDVANFTLGQETRRGSTFDYVEMSFPTPSKISFLYDGVDSKNFVARQDAVTQAHMTFRVVAGTTPGLVGVSSVPFGFLVPFAFNQSVDATTGVPVFVDFNESTIALGVASDLSRHFRTFQPSNGLSDNYHTLDLVLDGPQQRATLFLDGAEIIRLNRADLDEMAVGWGAGVGYSRFGAMRSATDNAALRIAEFSVFGHTGIRVDESCASFVPLTGKRYSFGMQCSDKGVWTDDQMYSVQEQCAERNSAPCDITLNDELVLPSRAPTCTSDGWRLADNDWLDVAAETVGSFGTGDFRVSFEFKSRLPTVAALPGTSANMFVRSAEIPFPYTGPHVFFFNDGDIMVRQTHMTSDPKAGFLCELCQTDWNNWHTYVVEQYDGTLSFFIDGTLKGQTFTQPANASLILPAPVRFGANHGDPSGQNADGWMRHIRMDDAKDAFNLCQDKLLNCRSASATSMRKWCDFREL